MNLFKKGLSLLLLSATLTVALCGCGGDKADDSSQITIGIPQDLEESLDPHYAVAAGTKEILFNIFEGLVKPDKNGDLNPAVADSYTISEDGLTYTFHLRKGVKFHDGSAVTAEDVLYCIEKNADTSAGDANISAFSNIKNYYADGENIVIELNVKDPDFLEYMTMAIIPAGNTDAATNPIGTGPYKYVSRTPQENIILEAFDDYYGEKANIKNVTLKIVADADSVVMNLLGGSVDLYARISSTQVAQLANSDFNILEGTMNLVQALYLNNNVEPFNDVRVRQALSYAVDPKEIIDLAFDGKGTEIGSSMFPAFGKYYIDETKDYYEVDLDKAKELLTEAGYPDGFSFAIKVPSNYQPHIDTAQVIVEQLKKINVDAKIELVEWDSWLSDVYAGRDFAATVVGVDASTMTARAMLERFTSDSSKNFVNFASDAYDAEFAAAISATDIDEQTEHYKECEWILTKESANVYLQDLAEFVALNKKYTGYEFYPIYVMDIAKLKLAE
jgi:peptide/nickel transport system substrate-binding protein